jgi:hypothetical protein
MAIAGETGMKKNWLAVIHVAKTQLSLTEEEYRDILKERFNVRSAKELTPEQGKDLMDHFKSIGFLPTRRGNGKACALCVPRTKRDPIPENVIYPVSPGQSAKIKQLKESIKWFTVDGFTAWLLRYFNIKKIQTSAEASAVIWALLKLWRNQRRCSCVLVNKRNTRQTI